MSNSNVLLLIATCFFITLGNASPIPQSFANPSYVPNSTASESADDSTDTRSKAFIYYALFGVATVMFVTCLFCYQRRLRARRARLVLDFQRRNQNQVRIDQPQPLSTINVQTVGWYGHECGQAHRIDQDGMRLDVNDDNEAPPPYKKEACGKLDERTEEASPSVMSTIRHDDAAAIGEYSGGAVLPDYEPRHDTEDIGGLRRPEPAARIDAPRERV